MPSRKKKAPIKKGESKREEAMDKKRGYPERPTEAAERAAFLAKRKKK